MDKFLSVVNEDPSTGEIDGKKLKLFLGMVKAWDYAKMSSLRYWNFTMEICLFILVKKVNFFVIFVWL